MRARNLKPGFFLNEQLAELPPLGRLLFQGLWCMADREGRLEDRPRRIKAALLPYDDCGVDELLDQLHDAGFIVRYVAGAGQRFIQVVNFTKHQNPHYKELPSRIPSPDGWEDSDHVGGSVPESVRQAVFARDGFTCQECGATDGLSLDHIIPRSKGGTHEEDNLRTLCRRCNSAKNNREAAAALRAAASDRRPTVGQSSAEDSRTSPADSPFPLPDSLTVDSSGRIPDVAVDGGDAGARVREEAIAETVEVLLGAPFIAAERAEVERHVRRCFRREPRFDPRDGPGLAELFAGWREYRDKPPADPWGVWLRWLRREVRGAPSGPAPPPGGLAGAGVVAAAATGEVDPRRPPRWIDGLPYDATVLEAEWRAGKSRNACLAAARAALAPEYQSYHQLQPEGATTR